MKLKNTRIIYLIVEIATVLLAALSFLPQLQEYRTFLLIGALVLLVVAAFINYNYWRCPNCDEYLGKAVFNPKKECENCGWKVNLYADYPPKK